MQIAIIGTGNVGGALAAKWAAAGHQIRLGVQNLQQFKGQHLLQLDGVTAHGLPQATQLSDIILIATPATAAVTVAQQLGNTAGKIIIDAMNVVMGRGPQGYTTTAQAILENTQTAQVIKCFNTTGYNNMANTLYNGVAIDAFMAGDSSEAKAVVRQLALDAGFGECYDVGGNDRFALLEQFAFFWINLAMMQGQGREIAFKLLKR
ncbi:MAG TPA: NAD(P)-binding domain-containing protein [Phnomibacter sp.]|nr:NAD(P)-binding domain-containing protein [Phnomibacter sp.]